MPGDRDCGAARDKGGIGAGALAGTCLAGTCLAGTCLAGTCLAGTWLASIWLAGIGLIAGMPGGGQICRMDPFARLPEGGPLRAAILARSFSATAVGSPRAARIRLACAAVGLLRLPVSLSMRARVSSSNACRSLGSSRAFAASDNRLR